MPETWTKPKISSLLDCFFGCPVGCVILNVVKELKYAKTMMH